MATVLDALFAQHHGGVSGEYHDDGAAGDFNGIDVEFCGVGDCATVEQLGDDDCGRVVDDTVGTAFAGVAVVDAGDVGDGVVSVGGDD